MFDFLDPWGSAANPLWEVGQGVQVWGHLGTRMRQNQNNACEFDHNSPVQQA